MQEVQVLLEPQNQSVPGYQVNDFGPIQYRAANDRGTNVKRIKNAMSDFWPILTQKSDFKFNQYFDGGRESTSFHLSHYSIKSANY